MKKAIACLLVMMFCMSLAGCGKEAGPEPTEPKSTTPPATVESAETDLALSNAVSLCQFVKDCQGEPDQFQVHGVSHVEKNGNHCYYLDYSHMVKNGELERSHYYAEFDGDVMLCIVNQNSAIFYETDGDYTEKYSALNALFQERNAEELDAEGISQSLG